jgi:hypothetical protein
LPDGNLTYRVKYPRRGRAYRTMTPIELLARLAALVPAPYFPLVRYCGVLGPGAKAEMFQLQCLHASPR